jgi:hypothetical protein
VRRPAETDKRITALRAARWGAVNHYPQPAGLGPAEGDIATGSFTAVNSIVEWIDGNTPNRTHRALSQNLTTATMPAEAPDEADVLETIEPIEPNGLFVIRTQPERSSTAPAETVVFNVTANDSHVGPARQWVELSRGIAAAGSQALRWDPAGAGLVNQTSLEPWCRMYSKRDITDSTAVARHACRDGSKLELVGICSGSRYAGPPLVGLSGPIDWLREGNVPLRDLRPTRINGERRCSVGVFVRVGDWARLMREYRFTSRSPQARVLCVSNREIAPVISRCIRYEFEDLVGDMDAVDVIAPVNAHDSKPKFVRTVWRLSAKAFRRLLIKFDGIVPITRLWPVPPGVSHDYELVVVSAETAQDLYDIGPSAMWSSTARVSACYIQELYAADVAELGDILTLLKNFDHIFLGYAGTVAPLAEATGRPCHYLMPHTDTIKFCPYPKAPDRVIDFYSMGRRPPETHQALLRIAHTRSPNWYYMYDTVTNCPVTSHVEHRQRLADMIMRSRLFLVNAARFNDPQRTAGQQELGFRFIEGAAGGAVLVGDSPCNDTFDEDFGWEDAVIPLPFDSGEIAEVIAALDADPIRTERISKTNVVNSLRRNDHVYRWGAILAIAGLEETAAMASRRRELAEMADSIERTVPASP